jgi:Cu(I)/Ag(I) efflux system protein CusF
MRHFAIVFITAALAPAASATMHEPSRTPSAPTGIAAADSPMSEGEVRKVDPSTKKLTIKHGELRNLDMPAMTMVFQVKDPSMIDKVKVGDKVKFRADKVNGAFIVMEIEPVK